MGTRQSPPRPKTSGFARFLFNTSALGRVPMVLLRTVYDDGKVTEGWVYV